MSLTLQPQEGKGIPLRLHRSEDTAHPLLPPLEDCSPHTPAARCFPGGGSWAPATPTWAPPRWKGPCKETCRHLWEGGRPALWLWPGVSSGAIAGAEGPGPSRAPGRRPLSSTTETLANREGFARLTKARAGQALPELWGGDGAMAVRMRRSPDDIREPRPGGQWWPQPPAHMPSLSGALAARGERRGT